MVSTDMTFWMVQKHELKFWQTGNAIFSGIVGLSHVKRIPSGFSGDASQDRSLLEEMHLDAFALCYERGKPLKLIRFILIFIIASGTSFRRK